MTMNYLEPYTIYFAIVTGFATLIMLASASITALVAKQDNLSVRLDTAQNRAVILLLIITIGFALSHSNMPTTWQFISFTVMIVPNAVIVIALFVQLFLDISKEMRTYTAYKSVGEVSGPKHYSEQPISREPTGSINAGGTVLESTKKQRHTVLS